jgi:restriction endonuclease S subunit
MNEEIEGRIDPFYYKREFIKFRNPLFKFKIVELRELIKDCKTGLPIRKDQRIEGGKYPYYGANGIIGYMDKFTHEGLFLVVSQDGYIGNHYVVNGKFWASNHNWVIKLKEGLNERYVKFILDLINYNYLVTGGVIPKLTKEALEKIKIPFPSLEIQNKIVSLMDEAYLSKKSKEIESQKLLDSINDYVLDELGIKLPELEDKMTYVVGSEEVKNNRCDSYYFQPKFEEIEKAVSKGKFEVKEIEKGIIVSNKLENLEDYNSINYVDLSSINKNLGLIKNYDKLNIEEAPSRARQKLEKGDLLLSGLVGSLKSIAIFEGNFNNAICSTGFYVIKNSKNYNNYYLWALFRSDILQMLLQRESSGAIMSAINREALSKLKIPLPPLSVQNKIADEVKKRMQKAESLQREAKEELEKAKLEVEKIILG